MALRLRDHDRVAVAPAHSVRSAAAAHYFEFAGRLVGKALLDRKGLDLPLSLPFLKAVLAGPSCAVGPGDAEGTAAAAVSFSSADVESFDPDVGRSLRWLEALVLKRDALLRDVRFALATGGAGEGTAAAVAPAAGPLPDTAARAKLHAAADGLAALWGEVENACLDFTLPGFPDVTLTLVPGDLEPAQQPLSVWAPPDPLSRDEGLAVAMATGAGSAVGGWRLARAASWFDAERAPGAGPGSVRGADVAVSLANLHVYVAGIVRTLCVDGVALQRDAFLRGLAVVSPSACVLREVGGRGVGGVDVGAGGGGGGGGGLVADSLLRAFEPADLLEMLGGAAGVLDDRNWTPAVVRAAIVIGSNMTPQSPELGFLARAVSELSVADRRLFLRYVTSTPRLPLGGLAALWPRFKVQRKDGGDSFLPAVSVCNHELKLPRYSSFEALRTKLLVAIREGHEGFSRA
jgi:hypothetical protein